MAENRLAEPAPKNSTPAELRAHFFERGNTLATEAETGSFEKVNKELADFRKTHTPKEFNALISAMTAANTAHVAIDQMDAAAKRVKRATIPTLILADSPKDTDKLPDHVTGRIVADPARLADDAGRSKSVMDAFPKVEVSDAAKEGRKRMRDTGNYGFGWSEAAAAAAYEDVLNPRR